MNTTLQTSQKCPASLLMTLAMGLCLNVVSSQAADMTFHAVETWSVTLDYDDFANGVTKITTFSGTSTGKITVRNGAYTLVNKSGVQVSGIDPDIITRHIYESGGHYSISGSYPFAPAYGAAARGILFLGAFIVSVPLVDGEVPAFYDFEPYSGAGQASAIVGGGFMKGVSLIATVQSTLSLSPAGGTTPPPDSPFATAAGNYAGLFHESSEVRPESSGLLTAKVTSSGTFSAKVTAGAGSAAFSGRFESNGKATNQITLGTETVVVELTLNLAEGDEMAGQIRGPTWTADLQTQRAAFNTKDNPATDLANRYTLLFPGNLDSLTEPAGDGYASVSISTAGVVSLKGALADGTPITYRAPVDKDGLWPIYLKLKGGAGSVLGSLQVDPAGGNAIQGGIHWFKAAGTKSPYYPSGFVLQIMAQGSVWLPFDPGRGGSEPEAISLSLTGGNLLEPLRYDATFSEQGKLIYSGADRIQFKLSPQTGLFSGTVKRADTGASIRFKGAVLQRQGYGAGFFLGTSQSGRLLVE